MPILILIADDLTGGNDTGVQLARQGVRCALAPCWTEELPPLCDTAEVWVFNTESRHCPPDEAARRVAKVVETARRVGAKAIYKKTDSVLRGPVGAELDAARSAWNSGPLVYVPAFPAAGRVMRGGQLFVNGIALAQTDFARDPLAPMTSSVGTEILAQTCPTDISTVSLDQLRSGPVDFKSLSPLIVVEGETENDLTLTARMAQQNELPTCWAGPAAFAFQLLELFHIPSGEPLPARCEQPFLLVNGSMHIASVSLKDAAIQSGFVPVEVDVARFAADGLAQAAVEALKNGKNVALYHVRMEGDEAAGINHRLTSLTQQILESVLPGTLILFGGETSQDVLRNTGSARCRIINQIDWGVVLMEAVTDLGEFKIITKSGGFGSPDFLERITS